MLITNRQRVCIPHFVYPPSHSEHVIYAPRLPLLTNFEFALVSFLFGVGPATGLKPGVMKPGLRAQWKAHRKLGDMSKEDAKAAYIKLLESVDPEWFSKQVSITRPKRNVNEVSNAASALHKKVIATPEQLKSVEGYAGHWIADKT